jgi:hypothetical protein
MSRITVREREAILRSLNAGLVPAIGLSHIQVGREDEVAAMIGDLNHVHNEAATVRFVVGRYGSGKTFFLHLLKGIALSKGFIVLQADITPDRRLQGTGGKARALYAELMNNLATRAKPEGGALANLVERWAGDLDHKVRAAGGRDATVHREFEQALAPLRELVHGYDFMRVLSSYCEGFHQEKPELQDAALRWLRGEFSTKLEARKLLPVRDIISDDNWYDYIKLWARFCRIAGYAGLLVNIDELVVLSHRLGHATARNNNYEAILKIVNDCFQGRACGVAFLFAGTPECLEDRRRGLFSYEALASRLATNVFASGDVKDFSGAVLRLENLSPEDCFVLLQNTRRVFSMGDPAKEVIPDEGIARFLDFSQQRIGAAYFQTPRETVKAFVGLLRVLEQNPAKAWHDILTIDSAPSKPGEDEFATPVPDSADEPREVKW